jgi:hypothetical protein
MGEHFVSGLALQGLGGVNEEVSISWNVRSLFVGYTLKGTV